MKSIAQNLCTGTGKEYAMGVRKLPLLDRLKIGKQIAEQNGKQVATRNLSHYVDALETYGTTLGHMYSRKSRSGEKSRIYKRALKRLEKMKLACQLVFVDLPLAIEDPHVILKYIKELENQVSQGQPDGKLDLLDHQLNRLIYWLREFCEAQKRINPNAISIRLEDTAYFAIRYAKWLSNEHEYIKSLEAKKDWGENAPRAEQIFCNSTPLSHVNYNPVEEKILITENIIEHTLRGKKIYNSMNKKRILVISDGDGAFQDVPYQTLPRNRAIKPQIIDADLHRGIPPIFTGQRGKTPSQCAQPRKEWKTKPQI